MIKIFEDFNIMKDYNRIYSVLKSVRDELITKYSEEYVKDYGLSGVCGEASKMIVSELKKIGYEAKLVEGDFLMDENEWM